MITLHVYKIHPLKKEFQIFTEHIFVCSVSQVLCLLLARSLNFVLQSKNDMQIDFHDDPNELRHLEFFFSIP